MKNISAKKFNKRDFSLFAQIFSSVNYGWVQFGIILAVGLIFIGMPQKPGGNDWDLNTYGFWSDIPHTYLANPHFVYPPWALILLLPYYWIRAEGVRFLSVLAVGWLAYKRSWPFSLFFAIILSPYFLVTMAISNMDILVVVFPILLWEYAQGKRFQNIARGVSLALLCLKPQCTILIMVFLIWENRKDWKNILIQLLIVALFVVPISLIGSPPLLFQWFNNIIHPSTGNQAIWVGNNISLTEKFGFWIALCILFFVSVFFYILIKTKRIVWKADQTISSLLFSSMFLMPYASMQSFIAGLAFIPSWFGLFFQWAIFVLGLITFSFYEQIHLWTLSIVVVSLFLYSFSQKKKYLKF